MTTTVVTRIPVTVGVLLDAAQAEVAGHERALALARQHLGMLVRVHLASVGVDPAGCRVDRDAEGWFHCERAEPAPEAAVVEG